MKKKPSELFEGKDSSLRKAYKWSVNKKELHTVLDGNAERHRILNSILSEVKRVLDSNQHVKKKMLAKKNKIKKEPDFLCNWDFCTTCVAYRKKHKLPMDKLKKHPK